MKRLKNLAVWVITSALLMLHAVTEAKEAPALAIDEGMFVNINGLDQWITIRGASLANPVMVTLHGGPGLASSHMAPLFVEWDKRFTRVNWDQPGGGATAVKTTDQGSITLQRYVTDGIAVVEYVRKRLRVNKVILFGVSWGTRLGIEMIKQRPDLFAAYVGYGQNVGPEGGLLGYQLALQAARERSDQVAIESLERVGPPPYKAIEDFFVRQRYTNPPGQPPSSVESAATAAMMKVLSAPPPPNAPYIAYRTLPAGYDGAKAFTATQAAIFMESGNWNARNLGLKFAIPMFIFQGENDFNTPTATARKYFEDLQAPRKAFAIIPGAGHNPAPFHKELLELLTAHVLPAVERKR